jgi:hypothetical protein
MDARWVRRQLAVFVFVVAAAGCGGGGAGGDADASINEPPLEPPTTLGPGFTELTTSFDDVPVGDVLGMRYWEGTDQSAAVSFGFFADLDGDAAPEVILATWADGTGRSNRVYGFDPAGALVERPDLLIPPGRVFAATDLDGDGATDFLIANGGVASRPELGAPLEALGWGDAAAGFVIAPDTPHYEDLRLNYRFEVGVALADVDQDGLVDIVGGVHSGAVVTLSRGGREFEPRPELLAGIAFAGNCGIQVASYDPAGLVMMGFGNTEAAGTRATFVRQRGYDADGYPRFEPLDAAPDEVYGNSGRVGGPSLADSAPMGGAYGDIDLDGFPDLVVTLDPVHAVMQWTGQWPLVDQTERAGFGRMKKRGLERLLLGWGTALLDIDRDGWLDVVTVHGADQQPQAGEPWPPTEQHHVTTHWSGGDFRFAEVTELTGLDKLGQWRALNFGDPDGDGDVDLIVGGYGELPRVYRNDVAVASGRGSASIRLRGTLSNSPGYGAEVSGAHPAGQRQSFYVGAMASPGTVAPALAFLSETDGGLVRDVVVRWPSGFEQTVGDLAVGRLHTIEEPTLVTLDPPSRHAPADGSAEVVIRVTPRRPDGSEDSDAAVQIEAPWGAAAFTGPVSRADGVWSRTLIAPSAPGSTVIEVHIDGKPLGVRPRVWWD